MEARTCEIVGVRVRVWMQGRGELNEICNALLNRLCIVVIFHG